MLPADYVTAHVELAYASTAHGVQGDTVTAAHVVIGEHTGAASAYVGMTRGRTANTAHLVAADLAEAREQWIAVFGRDRADLGPGHAAELAAREAARDRQTGSLDRPPATPPRSVPRGTSVRRPEAERRGPSLARWGRGPGHRSMSTAIATGRPPFGQQPREEQLEDFLLLLVVGSLQSLPKWRRLH